MPMPAITKAKTKETQTTKAPMPTQKPTSQRSLRALALAWHGTAEDEHDLDFGEGDPAEPVEPNAEDVLLEQVEEPAVEEASGAMPSEVADPAFAASGAGESSSHCSGRCRP